MRIIITAEDLFSYIVRTHVRVCAQRVRELSATVESRERSLLELSREHSRLREHCEHLEQHQASSSASGQEAASAQAERAYAQKLGELERRLNAANRVRPCASSFRWLIYLYS